MKKEIIHAGIADGLVFGALYLGLIEGWAPVLNAAIFVIWFVSLSGLLLAIAWDGTVERMPPEKLAGTRRRYQSRWWKAYDVTTDVALALILAAAGWFVTATVFAVGHVALKGRLYEWAQKEEVPA